MATAKIFEAHLKMLAEPWHAWRRVVKMAADERAREAKLQADEAIEAARLQAEAWAVTLAAPRSSAAPPSSSRRPFSSAAAGGGGGQGEPRLAAAADRRDQDAGAAMGCHRGRAP